jgi:hypothetical protein
MELNNEEMRACKLWYTGLTTAWSIKTVTKPRVNTGGIILRMRTAVCPDTIAGKKNIQFARWQVLWLVNVLVASRMKSIFSSDGDGELYGTVDYGTVIMSCSASGICF